MKRLVPLLFALSAAACTDYSPILLLGNRALEADCATGNQYVLAGALQIDVTRAYIAAFELESSLGNDSVTVNNDVVTPGSVNDFVVTRMVLNYFVVDGGTLTGLGVPQQLVPAYSVIPAGARRSESYMVGNVITPAAADAALARGGPFQMVVRVRIEGHTMGSPNTLIRSNTIDFPIEVTLAGCALGTTPIPVGDPPCGNVGQDTGLAVCQ